MDNKHVTLLKNNQWLNNDLTMSSSGDSKGFDVPDDGDACKQSGTNILLTLDNNPTFTQYLLVTQVSSKPGLNTSGQHLAMPRIVLLN